MLDRFIRDERGATAIEYGMIAIFIAATIAVTIRAGVGPALQKYFLRLEIETRA